MPRRFNDGPLILWLVCLSAWAPQSAIAGDIPGLPPSMPPLIERDFALNFSNDFLGRGGSVDDYRTQQLSVMASLSKQWSVIVDHSILTLHDADSPGRVDQLSASVAYQLFKRSSDKSIRQLTIGGGTRSAGDFAGERLQNGFHRLVGSDIESLPYVATDSTDLTAWFDASSYHQFQSGGNWSFGYSLLARSLLTSDGQWDSAVGATAVASRGSLNVWLGARHDWREGYDADSVQVATAEVENDTSIVFGIRYGALVLETVQQLHNDASYGQLSFISSGFRASNKAFAEPRASIEFNFLVPDFQLQLLGKHRTDLFTDRNSRWRESVFVDVRYGRPQFGDDETQYLDSKQLGAGMEWERNWSDAIRWVAYYAAIGIGYRSEQLISDDEFIGAKSDVAKRAVVTAGTGLRFNATSLGARWNYRLQLGLTAWAPLSDADVLLDGDQYSIQKPSLAIVLGMSFDFGPPASQ